MSESVPISQDDLHQLYTWVDEIPLSRAKRNISRDFADGCCVAQIVKFFFPKLVQLHNYTPAMSRAKKLSNWNTLNARVFRKLFFEVPPEEIEDIINAVPGAIERFLRALRIKIAQIVARREHLMKLAITQGKSSSNDHDNNAEVSKSPRRSQNTQNRLGQKMQSESNNNKNNNNNNNNDDEREEDDMNRENTNNCNGKGSVTIPSQHTLRALLNEKDRTILQLRETIGILSEKIVKLEQLVKVKDDKLHQYRSKFGRFS